MDAAHLLLKELKENAIVKEAVNMKNRHITVLIGRKKMANKVICGNHKCIYNDSTHCNLKSVALNSDGVCVLSKYFIEIKNKNENPLKGSNAR